MNVDVFLDSGAFSAWTRGIEIDIQKYIEFIKQNQDVITVYANLDVISKNRFSLGTKESAEKTLRNQKIMEEAGLSPLPVFHIGEPFEYLEYYVNHYDYIGLGGMVGKSKQTLSPWLDVVFGRYICDERGYPKVKVHGFGLTSVSLMVEYPWYSVDSVAWKKEAFLGEVRVPYLRQGKWIYDEGCWSICVTQRRKKEKYHIANLPLLKRKVVLKYFEEMGFPLGKSRFEKVPQSYEPKENERWAEKKPEDPNEKRLLEIIEEPGLCNSEVLRRKLNILFFQNLQKCIPQWPRPLKKGRLKKEGWGFEL